MNKLTKVTLSCDCGDPHCLGEQTIMLFAVFAVGEDTLEAAAKDLPLANKLEELSIKEGAKIRNIRAEADPAITCCQSIELVFEVLDAHRAKRAAEDSAIDKFIDEYDGKWIPEDLTNE